MTTTRQYESARRRNKKLNFKKFDINDGNVSKKINSFIEITSNIYTEKQIKKQIETNEYFKWWFVTDPIRQNIYEKEVIKYIKKIKDVKNVMKPRPKIFVSNGKLVCKNQWKIDKNKKSYPVSNKDVDISWEYRNYKCFAYHKYTKQSGGHQTNQEHDAESFIKALKSNKSQIAFFAILDGNYFQKKKSNGLSIIDELRKNLGTKKNIFVLPSEELEQHLRKLQ